MIRALGGARFALALALYLAATAVACWGQAASTGPAQLWYWLSDCSNGKMMGLEVLLNGKPIYHSSFRICQMPPADVQTGRKMPTAAFAFKGGHLFQGEYRTVPTQIVEGNIWQAGGEPDGLLLGVGFSSRHRVLLNSLHFVSPGRTCESKLDTGLFIRTYPVPRRVARPGVSKH